MTIDLRNMKPNQLLTTSKLTVDEIETMTDQWMAKKKKSKVAASFNNVGDLQEVHLKHFKSAPYMWKPMNGTIWAGMLLDDTIDYIHLVLVSENVMKYILEHYERV
jgi:hypothetical protein